MSSAETEAVLGHHMESFVATDLDAIMADFTEDSVLIEYVNDDGHPTPCHGEVHPDWVQLLPLSHPCLNVFWVFLKFSANIRIKFNLHDIFHYHLLQLLMSGV